MGDRISIQYKDCDKDLSIVLFSHWQGMSLKNKAQAHYETVVKPLHDQNGLSVPLSRMESRTVMVDFIRYLVKENPFKPVADDLYFGCTPEDGDNSDNGHYILDLKTGKWSHKNTMVW